MYFFYFDESGNRDTSTVGTRSDGSSYAKDHLYVLTAISLYERRWAPFDHELSSLKHRLRSRLYREKQISVPSLADCEIKSTALRLSKNPGDKGYSSFIHNLESADKTALADLFFSQLEKHHMRIFSVVVDKRELRGNTPAEAMHKKAYELVLERIEQFLHEFHNNHLGLIVMDDTQRQLNHQVAMKHAQFQREGNSNLRFRHIVEYPFFTDSKLSNGVQLSDLCSYNVYRAFREENFAYPYFRKMLPFVYRSKRTDETKLDGLKIWSETSPLVQFAGEAFRTFLQPKEKERPAPERAGL